MENQKPSRKKMSCWITSIVVVDSFAFAVDAHPAYAMAVHL